MVLERSDKVGGIARTEYYKGYYFDVGGHRFLTKIASINRLWCEILGDDFLKVPRLSRIYYGGAFYSYPLSLGRALFNLGAVESFLIVLSYLQAQVWPHSEEKTFEQWVSNRFGPRLYATFFRTYTEKVWGIPCHKIQADWAAQRIKGLSLIAVLSNALLGIQKAKSLVSEFYYPRRGPGMMWEGFRSAVEQGGGRVFLNTEAVDLDHHNGKIQSIGWVRDGKKEVTPVEHLITSLPVSKLIFMLRPSPPEEVLAAARNLSYRAFVMVGLIIEKDHLFPDQWIYVHSPNVRVGRIQNFKNWSPAMVPDPNNTSVGMEYFCDEGDDIWSMPDDELAALASRELNSLGLVQKADVVDHFVIRQPKAYPIYDEQYFHQVSLIRRYLATLGNLQTIGRNGMHRYNNMDHSMITGIQAAQNILGATHDLWETNEEADYIEEDKQTGRAEAIQRILAGTFAKMDKLAFATATGLTAGLGLFMATIWLIIKGGDVVGPNLSLLGQYFIGYTVTVKGAFVAFGYSFFWAFLFGWLFAYLRNLSLVMYLFYVKRKEELLTLSDFFDNL
jgi:protoporphyrinogen oxidase